jgi:hypothetical protein
MKKQFIVVGICASCLISCHKELQQGGVTKNGEFKIVIIDGCQYILMATSDPNVVTHKGDCTNRIHIYRVEQ